MPTARLVALLLSLLYPNTLTAQIREPSPEPTSIAPAQFGAGVLGGAAGAILGWHVGQRLGQQLNADPCVGSPDHPLACEWQGGAHYWDDVGAFLGIVTLESLGVALAMRAVSGGDLAPAVRSALVVAGAGGTVGAFLYARTREKRILFFVSAGTLLTQIRSVASRLSEPEH